jgi:succinate dehydrogenase / fumarate reductase iron-sulfur subunit
VAPSGDAGGEDLLRLADCIECGLCISACPVMATAPRALGPAPLSAAEQTSLGRDPQVLARLDSADGLWRCHNSFECSAVCPSAVDPAQRIMGLRRQVVGRRLKQLFGGRKENSR